MPHHLVAIRTDGQKWRWGLDLQNMANNYEPQPVVRRRNADGSAITLFRYFSLNKLDTFLTGRLGLTPPKFLNDPLEFAVSRVPPDRKEVEEMFDNFVVDEYNTRTDADRIQMPFAEFRQQKYIHREDWISRILSQDYQDSHFQVMQENLSHFWGVICLSEVGNSFPMWTHYTKSYEGFVAEFACEWEHLSHIPQARGLPFGPAFKVSYSKERPLFDRTFSNAAECLCTKDSDWSYERDWRIVRLLATSETIQRKTGYRFAIFPPSSLKRIVIGDRMPDLQKQNVVSVANDEPFKHVEVQRAVPNLATRTISFECV